MDRQQKRLEKILARDRRLDVLYRQCPRLHEIESQFARIALDLGFISLGQPGKLGLDRKGLKDLRKQLAEEKRQLLAERGLTEEMLEIQWDCPLCEDRGFVEFGEKCACLVQQELDEHFHRSGLREAMRRQTFANFVTDWYPYPQKMDQVKEEALAFAESILHNRCQHNLYFYGDVGTGKTHLSSAIANHLIAGGRSVLYQNFGQLMDSLREEMFKGPGNDRFRWLNVDLLILDDVGSENPSAFVLTEFFRIINERLYSGKPWIISTNLSEERFADIYGDRISDRVFSSAKVFCFEGESIRFLKRDRMTNTSAS